MIRLEDLREGAHPFVVQDLPLFGARTRQLSSLTPCQDLSAMARTPSDQTNELWSLMTLLLSDIELLEPSALDFDGPFLSMFCVTELSYMHASNGQATHVQLQVQVQFMRSLERIEASQEVECYAVLGQERLAVVANPSAKPPQGPPLTQRGTRH